MKNKQKHQKKLSKIRQREIEKFQKLESSRKEAADRRAEKLKQGIILFLVWEKIYKFSVSLYKCELHVRSEYLIEI